MKIYSPCICRFSIFSTTWIKIRKYFLIWWLLHCYIWPGIGTKKWICVAIFTAIAVLVIVFCILCYLLKRRAVVNQGVYIYIILKFTNSWLLIWYMQIMIFYGNLNREWWNKRWKWIACFIELGLIYQHEWNSKWLEWWSSFQCY